MEIKDVRFSHATANVESGNCGICSVNVGDIFIIHGIKVLRVNGSLKVVLPERKVSETGRFKPVVTYVNRSKESVGFKEELTTAVLNQYYNEIGLK